MEHNHQKTSNALALISIMQCSDDGSKLLVHSGSSATNDAL